LGLKKSHSVDTNLNSADNKELTEIMIVLFVTDVVLSVLLLTVVVFMWL